MMKIRVRILNYMMAGKYGYAFVENYQERDAYWFQIKMGAGSFFEGYSRYIDYRNLTPK